MTLLNFHDKMHFMALCFKTLIVKRKAKIQQIKINNSLLFPLGILLRSVKTQVLGSIKAAVKSVSNDSLQVISARCP